MSNLLPAAETIDEFRRARKMDVAAWTPGIHVLAARHGLEIASITRFSAGENPVFAVGEQIVLKLVPSLRSRVLQRELSFLRFLDQHADVPTARPIAHGQCENWHYLFSSRLPGRQLDHVWPQLPADDQEGLAVAMGQLLRRLHDIPLAGLELGDPAWTDWLPRSITTWTARHDTVCVPPALREDAPRFLAQQNLDQSLRAPLHDDLAPENLLVQRGDSGWHISGMIDFGNGMAGDPLFDLVAPSVVLAPAQRTVAGWILEGYDGRPSRERGPMRDHLMAYMLIHPMGDFSTFFSLYPAATACRSWAQVARLIWPELD